MFLWRDNLGHEFDILHETPQGLQAIEIKSCSTKSIRACDEKRWMKITAPRQDAALTPRQAPCHHQFRSHRLLQARQRQTGHRPRAQRGAGSPLYPGRSAQRLSLAPRHRWRERSAPTRSRGSTLRHRIHSQSAARATRVTVLTPGSAPGTSPPAAAQCS